LIATGSLRATQNITKHENIWLGYYKKRLKNAVNK
jgi:hypothetical protein